jgi:hypothetical protein
MDMAVLVDAQGDMLDNIEVQVIEQLSWMMILSWISFKSRQCEAIIELNQTLFGR